MLSGDFEKRSTLAKRKDAIVRKILLTLTIHERLATPTPIATTIPHPMPCPPCADNFARPDGHEDGRTGLVVTLRATFACFDQE